MKVSPFLAIHIFLIWALVLNIVIVIETNKSDSIHFGFYLCTFDSPFHNKLLENGLRPSCF